MATESPRRQTVARLALLLLIASGLAAAQAQQVYRYIDKDGRVVYTDKPPPANAKNPQTKRLAGNQIVTSNVSYADQMAQERFPVTLYTFDCGVVCDSAQGLLNKRGVPHTVVDVSQNDGADKLKRLTGGLDAPALQVGDQFASGFSEGRWQALLNEAGYAKTPPARTIPASKAAPAIEPGAGTTKVAPVPEAAKGSYPK
jgi:glutaredoxin